MRKDVDGLSVSTYRLRDGYDGDSSGCDIFFTGFLFEPHFSPSSSNKKEA